MRSATAPGSASVHGADATTEDGRRLPRLAELVAELTGCTRPGALHAVRASGTPSDPLAVVARAMVHVDAPVPSGLRVTGFLRDDLPPLLRRVGDHRLPRRVTGRLPHRQALRPGG